ncbi:FAD-binding protein, partial [Pseudomonas sp. FSL R10-1339]|uniref:FAD-binding protein n=1 Tax=Pseudomonas sp. FSL R10-1339 TaxID=2662196 RepID=UPI001294BB7B
MRSADNVDTSALLLEQVNQALQYATPLRIQGANSKAFLGRSVAGEVLDTRGHRGIVSYDPTELVITARCGTPLMELAQALAIVAGSADRQRLPAPFGEAQQGSRRVQFQADTQGLP